MLNRKMNRAEKRHKQKLVKKAAKTANSVESMGHASAHKILTINQQVLTIEQAVNLALHHHSAGRLPEAESIYRQILQADPNQPIALHLLGVIAYQTENHKNAVELITKALIIKPDYADAHSNLGNALQELGKLDEAIDSFHKAIAIRPNYVEAHFNLGNAFRDLGKLDEAVASYFKALTINPDYAVAYGNLALAEQYRASVTLNSLKTAHALWERKFGAPLQKKWETHSNRPDPEKRLRIGFISSNLGRHPVGYFVVKFLDHRPTEDLEIICYSNSEPDDLTERIKASSDEWTDARGVSDEDLYRRIRSDRIDILIDLSGYTAENRLLVVARKPAPIQVKWVGYAGSTGLSAISYLIADDLHIPEDTEHKYDEKVIRLPDGYISYEPPYYAPKVGPLPFERNDYITFASINNPAKINDDVLTAWAKILKAIPNSRLVLKYKNMEATGNRKRILDRFGDYEIEETRLTLEGRSPHVELLARYNDVDIALDTFPYTGGLTTCEAVWMGVPVITIPGETFASRHSLSHLTNVGVPELVANDEQDYVTKAVDLANDIPRLSSLRSGLREQMAKSPLCDGKKFATNFTFAMRSIWREWCSSQSEGDHSDS